MNATCFKEFKSLEISDKPLFERFLTEDPPQASEYTFTNLFMWRRKYDPKWMVYSDCLLVIIEEPRGMPLGLQPVGRGSKRSCLDYLSDAFQSHDFRPVIGRVTDDFVDTVVDESRFDLIEDFDNSDYVYLAEKLIKLSGNKYHKKRNHLNRFMKNYDFEYRNLTPDLIDDVLSLQEAWCEFKDCYEDDNLFYEDSAICDALTNYQALGLKGGAILIDGKVQAFSFGELLNPETAVVHIEKANPEIDGLYTAINQQYCEAVWTNVKFINREQDLGLEGLRQAKQSYYPHHMVNKWIVQMR